MAGPHLARKTTKLLVLGQELTRIREDRGLTDEDIRRGGVDPSAVRRWLSGETKRPRRATVELLLTIFGVQGGHRAELLDLALNPVGPAWLRTYERALDEQYATFIGFEADARWMGNWEPATIPGLLQTAAYTETLIRAVPGVTDEHVARQLEVRVRRQAVLADPDGLHLHAIVHEAAVRTMVGGPAVMRPQLQALAQENRPNVTLQVLPFSAGAHGGTGPFAIMRFRDPRAPAVTFAETVAGLNIVDHNEHHDDIWGSLMSQALNPQDSAAFFAAAADEIE